MNVVILTTKATVTRATVDGARRALGLDGPVDVISWAPVDLGPSVRTLVAVGPPPARTRGSTRLHALSRVTGLVRRKLTGVRRRFLRMGPVAWFRETVGGGTAGAFSRRTGRDRRAMALLHRADVAVALEAAAVGPAWRMARRRPDLVACLGVAAAAQRLTRRLVEPAGAGSPSTVDTDELGQPLVR